jgi:ElaB/YqjD/DUF883 family membrane-anchored ribosome-binding protein
MQTTTGNTPLPSSTLPSGGPTTGTMSSESPYEANAVNSGQVMNKIRPAIDRVAQSAHQAVDKAVHVAVPTAEWLSTRGESFKATQDRMLNDARRYVSSNPMKSVGVAVAAGLLLGRILR